MQVNPYLFFNGQCEAAFQFYEQCLGGKIVAIHRFEGSPMTGQVPSDWGNKVMHISLQVGSQVLMGSDATGEHYQKPQGFRICLGFKNTADGERVFKALVEGGTAHMPFQKTFWSEGFGMLSDRFGIPWMISCESAG
ncbi:MAG TPA: VOC family protein [Bryobacteraceae bacterium]